MSQNSNTIEINGKRYDAISGKPVQSHAGGKGANVDGIVCKRNLQPAALISSKPKPAPLTTITKTKVMDMQPPKRTARTAAPHAKKHQTQGSQTLMRTTVQSPQQSFKRRTNVQSHTGSLVPKTTTSIEPKTSSKLVAPERLRRAKQTPRSPHIARFPKAIENHTQVLRSNHTTQAAAASSIASSRKQPDIFEQALERATSHLQPKHSIASEKSPRMSGKRTGYASVALAFLLLAGFIGFENRTALTLRAASSKIGFSASVPQYRPAGFSLGKLAYSAGNVALNFHSNSDQRNFALIEKASNWDSATLRDSFVASVDSHYQTVNVAGQTVYVYGNNNAAWMNGGIWYQVQSNGSLNSEQLTQIAASL